MCNRATQKRRYAAAIQHMLPNYSDHMLPVWSRLLIVSSSSSSNHRRHLRLYNYTYVQYNLIAPLKLRPYGVIQIRLLLLFF